MEKKDRKLIPLSAFSGFLGFPSTLFIYCIGWEKLLALLVFLTCTRAGCRFLRGDQYAIALALLDEGRVVLGVLACPNLPQASIGHPYQNSLQTQVGCLFSARIGAGTDMQLLHGSSPAKVGIYIFYRCLI